jgi:hypothetical protein
MMLKRNTPHCPSCIGKPHEGQRGLTEDEKRKLSGRALFRVSARQHSVSFCPVCRNIYDYRNGFSTPLGWLPA